ncbi:hypothetical protein V490_01015 [Pseudogymnoascus sp. VKM F-3557]|nr:hypothetical protein V490_01015 [Pseudogymnoascus sp. VKM F-3557]
MADSELAPKFAPFLGMAGASFAMIFGCMGAAYGTARSGAACAAAGVERPDLVMKSLLPTVMAGIISVYALVVSLLIVGDMYPSPTQNYSLYSGNLHLAAGISVGMTGLAAGYGIGVIGEHGIRAYLKQSRIFVALVLLLIFAEVLGLYGSIFTRDLPTMDYNHDRCPSYAPFFGAMGCAAAIVFTCFGASYGMAKSSIGIMASSILRPDLIVRNLMPPILAGILSIYGLVVAVIISGDLKEQLPIYSAFLQLGAGISVGLCGLAAGFAIGIIGDGGVRGVAQQPKLFVAMILILIFAEVLGLYGMIVALMLKLLNVPNTKMALIARRLLPHSDAPISKEDAASHSSPDSTSMSLDFTGLNDPATPIGQRQPSVSRASFERQQEQPTLSERHLSGSRNRQH